MRGKETILSICREFGGITPAYAGKSAASRGQPPASADHPRVCGEKRLNGFKKTGR